MRNRTVNDKRLDKQVLKRWMRQVAESSMRQCKSSSQDTVRGVGTKKKGLLQAPGVYLGAS